MRRALAALALAVALPPAAARPAVAADEAVERVHVVQPGETLWQIAALVTGDPTLWQALYRANRDQIRDPAVLYPGQRLEVPALREPGKREEGQAVE